MAPIPEQVRTVSQITREIKSALESRFSAVAVTGEISNLKRHSSGHVYFTLKDEGAQLSAVLFRGNALRMFFQPQEGMEVICTGDITVYEPRGNYQILVREMIPKGEGALALAFERLKRRLSEEGLFDPSRKKPLPRYPERIAIVTSPTGAAVRDLVSVMRRRMPSLEILLLPVQVQGAGAAEQIAAALDLCNEHGQAELIIVGRGGGSMEDLWAFNEEIVARAIARSRIPVVSAVGHEIDVTISDFVADLRAPTPSAAAELATPETRQLLEALGNFSYTCSARTRAMLRASAERLRNLLHRRAFHRTQDQIRTASQRLDVFLAEMHDAVARKTVSLERNRAFYDRQLVAMNPGRLLRKGYSIARKEGTILRSVADIEENEKFDLTVSDGHLTAAAEKKFPDEPEKKGNDI